MKKILALILMLLSISSFGSASAIESSTVQIEEDPFIEMASEEMRQRYEALGYTEVQLPARTRGICDEIDISSEIRFLAYMNIEDVSPEMQDRILEARREIIYKAGSWYVDDGSIYVVWGNDDTREWGEIPRFSELFPGWDPPTTPAVLEAESELNEYENILRGLTMLFNGNVSITNPPLNTITTPFKTWNVSNKIYYFKERVNWLTNATSCNLGLTNMSVTPNQSIYFVENLVRNGYVEGLTSGAANSVLGFRASTYSASGTAQISIEFELQ